MNAEKLSSDQVPQKFAEWLLSIGCPSEKVPSVEKLTEICRGPYYMVWRSLMEIVEHKDFIRRKRMQIFIDDIQRCEKRNAFCKPDSSVVVPEELSLWKQQRGLKEKLEHAEMRLKQSKQECDKLVDKVSSRLSHRNVVRVRVENAQRRAWLLQHVAEELRNKKANLLETKTIADSLSVTENKLDKCTSSRRQSPRVLSTSTSSLQTSIPPNNGDVLDSEDYISLARRDGAALWPELCERRAALGARLERACASNTSDNNSRDSPSVVLSQSASLQCSLALGALKHRAHVQTARNSLAHALAELQSTGRHQSSESCELLVVLSELASVRARLDACRELLRDVTQRRGTFAVLDQGTAAGDARKQIVIVDKAIENKRDELKRVITSLTVTERKIQNVRECLVNVFNSFHTEPAEGYSCNDRFGGLVSLPQESFATLHHFYEQQREKQTNRMQLSFNFDASVDYSYNEENRNATYIDELKVYLKKFNLEDNRKLILENGKKIWISETVEACIRRLYTRLQDLELACSLVCPSVSLRGNLHKLVRLVDSKQQLSEVLTALEGRQMKHIVIDVPSQTEEEQNATDKIKKRHNENLLSLQKTLKTLDLGQENLKLWSDNEMRKHISTNRKVDGRTYKEYESCYVENLSLNM